MYSHSHKNNVIYIYIHEIIKILDVRFPECLNKLTRLYYHHNCF